MKCALVIAYLANVILSIVGLLVLPEPVASHFGEDGLPNEWMKPTINFWVMFLVYSLIFILFIGIPSLLRKIPKRLLSLPNKDYWLLEENWAEFNMRLRRRFHQYGFATLMFFFCEAAMVLDANLADPIRLQMEPFWVTFSAFMLYTVLWVSQVFRALALPHEAPAAEL